MNVKQNEINIQFDNAFDQLDYETSSLEYLSSTLHSPKEEIAKEVKKDIYHSLFHQYQQNDDNTGFLDLKVSDLEMSFETEDIGRFKFYRK